MNRLALIIIVLKNETFIFATTFSYLDEHKPPIMNKIITIIFALLLCGVAEAQTKTNKSSIENKKYFKTGYRGFIATGVGVSGDFKNKEQYLCLSDITIQGYQMSDHMFVGLGIGRHLYIASMDNEEKKENERKEEYSSFPIFSDVRYEFHNRVNTPFLDIQCGGTLGDFKGLHFAFSLGYRSGYCGYLLGHLNYSFGYSLQTYKYDGLTTGQGNENRAINSFMILRVAYDWGARLK